MTKTTNGSVAVCDIDFYNDAALTDPVECYHKILSTGPIVFLPKNDIHAICGYDAVTSTLRDHRVFRSARGFDQ